MVFSESFLETWNPLIRFGCAVHDRVSGFLLKYLKQVRIGLLVVAHLSLLGLLVPDAAQSFGSLARDVLLVIMLSSPMAKLFRMKLLYQIVGLRRELGILFGYLGIVHGLGFMLDPQWSAIFIVPFAADPLAILPRYLFGIFALILTLPLLITSNNLSLKILKGNWKRLHWLTYPMFAFVLLHTFLPGQPGASREIAGWTMFILAFGGYVLLKMLARNNFLAPLREINEHVGRQYREYGRKKIER